MATGSSFLSYVQLLDSALPIGGFSHSFGLETYVQQNKVTNIQQLEQYIHGQIHASLVRLEGLTIKGVYLAMEEDDLWRVCLFDKIIHVQRIPRESREGIQKMGKRLIRLGHSLYPEANLSELEHGLELHGGYGTLPVVHAWISHKLGVPCDEAVKGYLYTSLTTMVNSALRLMSLGQTEGQQLIRRMLIVIDQQWEILRELPAERLHAFTPAHDIRAIQHETLYSRLFMS
jgi:urease accessory protein